MSTFYIDPSGNDSTGTGAIGSPWKTLFKATSTVTSGNIIHVNAGTYLETSQSILATGVSVEGDGDTSIIQSTASADFVPIIVANSAEGTNGNQHISNLKFDGRSRTTSWGVAISGRSNTSVHHCTFIDFNQTAVFWKGRNDSVDAPPSIYATGNSFHDNITINCSGYFAFGTGHLYYGGQQDFLIYNNTMTQTGRGAGLNGWLLKCQANDGYTKNNQIYNNVFTKDPNYGGTFDFAIESFHNEGFVVHDNAFHGAGLDMNFQTKGIYTNGAHIYNNTFDYPVIPTPEYQNAITIEFTSDTVLIENNVSNGAATFVLQTPRANSSFTDVTIRNNLAYNMGVAGSDGYGVRWNTSPLASGAIIIVRNYRIEHNTFVVNPTSGSALYGIRLPDGDPDVVNAIVDSDNIYIDNNILKGFTVAPVVANPASGINHLYIRNNIFYANGNSNNPIYSNGSPLNALTISLFKTDPLLNSSYLPNAGSPALNAATDGTNIGYSPTGTNIPPVADAGIDKTITTSTTSLTGSGTDTDGTIISHVWTQVSGPNTAIITSPVNYTTIVSGLTSGVYIFRLTVTDNNAASGSDDITITIPLRIKRKIIVL